MRRAAEAAPLHEDYIAQALRMEAPSGADDG